MAGLFDFLYGEGQALAFISKGVALGQSLEEVSTELAKGGLLITAPKVEQVYNYLNNVVLPSQQYVKQLQLNAQPNLIRLPLSLTPTLRNFSYHLQLDGVDIHTGVQVTKYMTISTNTLLSKQQAIDIGGELATDDTESGGLVAANISVIHISQNSAGLVSI